MRILGVDPGLTRCGIAVVEVAETRQAQLVHVVTARSKSSVAVQFRLAQIGQAIEEVITEYEPEIMAIERVFVQDNLQSVTTTMQVMGAAMYVAGKRRLPVAIHTPSEVKAAVTGSGTAPKAQVQEMVRRVLGLSEIIRPADAADAVAIALCQGFRGTGIQGVGDDGSFSVTLSGGVAAKRELTPAQKKWAAAQAQLHRTGAVDPRRRQTRTKPNKRNN